MKKIKWVVFSMGFLVVMALLITMMENRRVKVGEFSMEDVAYIGGEGDDIRYEDMVEIFLAKAEYGPADVRGILEEAGYEFFTDDLALGRTESPRDAVKKAELVWIEVLEKTQVFGDMHTKEYRPYKVFYDSDRAIWLVMGSLGERWYHKIIGHFFSSSWYGGVPYILIQKSDGKILAVWHDA